VLIKGRSGLVVELKEPGTETDVIEHLREYGLTNETTMVSFYNNTIRQIKKAHPGIKCGVIFSGNPVRPERLAKDAKEDIILPNHTYVDSLMVREAHDASILSRRGQPTARETPYGF